MMILKGKMVVREPGKEVMGCGIWGDVAIIRTRSKGRIYDVLFGGGRGKGILL